MAILNLSYDTNTKALVGTFDGKALSNIASISLYQDYDEEEEFELRLSMKDTTNRDDGYRIYTEVCAAFGEKRKPVLDALANSYRKQKDGSGI